MNRERWHTTKRAKRVKGSQRDHKYVVSPRIACSYPAEDFRVLTAYAESKGKTVAQVLRDALFAYLLPIRGNFPGYREGIDHGKGTAIQKPRPGGRDKPAIRSPGRTHERKRGDEARLSGADQVGRRNEAGSEGACNSQAIGGAR